MARTSSGTRMPRSSVNFSRGRILPRATPARYGTRHSISLIRFSSNQRSISFSVKLLRLTNPLMMDFLVLLCAPARPDAARLRSVPGGRLLEDGRAHAPQTCWTVGLVEFRLWSPGARVRGAFGERRTGA